MNRRFVKVRCTFYTGEQKRGLQRQPPQNGSIVFFSQQEGIHGRSRKSTLAKLQQDSMKSDTFWEGDFHMEKSWKICAARHFTTW